MTDFTVVLALIAGLVSFLSPCVLPLIPGFLAYLAGGAVAGEKPKRLDTFLASVFFVLGFAAVFSLLGVLLNTLLEAVAYDVQIWLARGGGALIIFFGLYLMGLIKLPFLEREHKLTPKMHFHSRQLTAFLFGAAFAAGWTPCVGAVLGGILGLAATKPGSAFGLLFSYSVGLGLPFLAVGLFASQATALIRRFSRWLKPINIVFGVILVAIGVLAFTKNLNLIANLEFMNRVLLR